MNTPRTGGMRSAAASIPSRHAHALVAVASTCLLSLASALFLALGASDDPWDRGTVAVRGVRGAVCAMRCSRHRLQGA
jgi:hypothetical protein